MATLIGPAGTTVHVADGQVDNLVGRGFRRADEATPETEAPAEPEATTDEGQGGSDPEPEPEPEPEPLPEAKPAENKTGEAEPVKRGPGRPRKS